MRLWIAPHCNQFPAGFASFTGDEGDSVLAPALGLSAIAAESALLTKDDSRFDSADARFGTPNAEVVDSAPKDDALEERSFVETVCAMIMVAEKKGFEPSIRF